MNVIQVRAIAKERGINSKNVKKIEMVQMIQCAEGNEPCYSTGKAVACGQIACIWKDDCK